MEMFKCDVTRPIPSCLFTLSNERYTLCNITNERRLDFEGLDVNLRQCRSVSIVGRRDLFGIQNRCVPLSQMSSHKSTASEFKMACIVSRGDQRGQ